MARTSLFALSFRRLLFRTFQNRLASVNSADLISFPLAILFSRSNFRNVFSLTAFIHNTREKQRNAKCIVDMQSSTTLVFNPSNLHEQPKKFTFDYSYWSHDGYTQDADNSYAQSDPSHPNGDKYADQVGEKSFAADLQRATHFASVGKAALAANVHSITMSSGYLHKLNRLSLMGSTPRRHHHLRSLPLYRTASTRISASRYSATHWKATTRRYLLMARRVWRESQSFAQVASSAFNSLALRHLVGSGKSYSVIGYGANKGTPRATLVKRAERPCNETHTN